MTPAGFALEAFEVCFFRSQFGRQDFNDDGAAEFPISRFVNCALPAHAELFEDFVIAEGLSNHDFL